jgi:two-component system response regulator PilR (NtrC family)
MAEELPTGFVGRSPKIVQIRGQLEKLADRRTPVLILGESGTGKEVAARALYNECPRGQFVPIDCGFCRKENFGRSDRSTE